MDQTVAAIQSELAHLSEVEVAAREAARAGVTGVALEMARGTLAARGRDLLFELAEALRSAGCTSLVVELDGDPVREQPIEVAFLASVLEHTQRTISAIGQAVVATPTRRGQIRTDIVSATTLRVVAISAGSFCLHLAAEASPNLLAESVVEESLDGFDRLLAAGDDPDELTTVLNQLGPRVHSQYDALLDTLASSNASMRASWVPALSERRPDRHVEPAVARRIRSALALVEHRESQTRVLVGRLVGLLQMRQDFEFIPADTDDVVRGRVSGELVAEAARAFGQYVTARFEVAITVSPRVDEPKEAWTLVGLGAPPDADQ